MEEQTAYNIWHSGENTLDIQVVLKDPNIFTKQISLLSAFHVYRRMTADFVQNASYVVVQSLLEVITADVQEDGPFYLFIACVLGDIIWKWWSLHWNLVRMRVIDQHEVHFFWPCWSLRFCWTYLSPLILVCF